MKKKFGDLVLSVFLFVIGICLLYWSDEVIMVVTILLGSTFILYGIITLIKYLRANPKSILSIMIGVLSIIIGIILLFRQTIISEIISFIVGLYIIITSIGSLMLAIEQHGNNYALNIGLSITGIVIGILCVIGKLLIPNIVLEFMGVLLIIFSVTNVINALITPSK